MKTPHKNWFYFIIFFVFLYFLSFFLSFFLSLLCWSKTRIEKGVVLNIDIHNKYTHICACLERLYIYIYIYIYTRVYICVYIHIHLWAYRYPYPTLPLSSLSISLSLSLLCALSLILFPYIGLTTCKSSTNLKLYTVIYHLHRSTTPLYRSLYVGPKR